MDWKMVCVGIATGSIVYYTIFRRVSPTSRSDLPRQETTERGEKGERSEKQEIESTFVTPVRTYTSESQALLSLIYSLASEQARKDAIVHRSITCNACQNPVRGIRYKCMNCVDYDICEGCEARGGHDFRHCFVKIRIPVPPLANPRCVLGVEMYPGTFEGDVVYDVVEMESLTHCTYLCLMWRES